MRFRNIVLSEQELNLHAITERNEARGDLDLGTLCLETAKLLKAFKLTRHSPPFKLSLENIVIRALGNCFSFCKDLNVALITLWLVHDAILSFFDALVELLDTSDQVFIELLHLEINI